MLKQLHIQNYALIDTLDIDLKKGLSTITGETGAGKSIILGALSLVLGKRADSSSLREPLKKCIVEANFKAPKTAVVKQTFDELDLDEEDEIILRREINKEGKSRSFINDTPVKLSSLKQVGSLLIDIHSQPDNRTISEQAFQINALDAFAGNAKLKTAYSKSFAEYRKLKSALQELLDNSEKSKEEMDYLMFQYAELQEAELEEGEQEKMESELAILEKADTIRESLSDSLTFLSDDESGAVNQLRKALLSLQSLSDVHDKINEIVERLQISEIELNDISTEAEVLLSDVQADPSRLSYLQERLSTIYRLQKKHHRATLEELISLREDLGSKISKIESLDENIENAQKDLNTAEQVLSKCADDLTKSRTNNSKKLEKSIGKVLAELGMKNAILNIQIDKKSNHYSESGVDEIKWLFTANKGASFQELRKVASGGELSRLMLAIKTTLSKVMAFPTLIFDEIDTGVSGEIAMRVGKQMKLIAKDTQVLSITHLPQIASQGDQQLLVFKSVDKDRTISSLKELNSKERITEIAKMLSGKRPSSAAISNARDLLEENYD